MGILGEFTSYLFGSSAKKYSSVERQLSEHDLRRLLNHERIPVLDNQQADKVRTAILARRRGDGKISLRQIFEVLQDLVNTHAISRYDRDAVMKMMKTFFEQRSRQHL